MQVVSSAEFATHQDKYLNMAVDHDICIKKGRQMFRITYEPILEEQPVLQPDDNLRRAISAEEFRKSALEIVEKVHHKFYGNERQVCPGNA